MKFNKVLSASIIASIALSSLTAQAYIIHNKTQATLHVYDKGRFMGFEGNIPPGGSAACDGNSWGCSGKMLFYVYDGRNYKSFVEPLLCGWFGEIDKEPNHVFTILQRDPADKGDVYGNGYCYVVHTQS